MIQNRIEDHAFHFWDIPEEIIRRGKAAEEALSDVFRRAEKVKSINQLRVLHAMQAAGVSDSGFGGTTGYGYDDLGRAQLEKAFALAFGAQKAYVRTSITTGTQAIAACFYGLLRPGDELLSLTGLPYDTLLTCIGAHQSDDVGSLRDFGIHFRAIEMTPEGLPDLARIRTALSEQTKLVLIQRSKGYADRQTLSIEQIAVLVDLVRAQNPDCYILVDNCYGEFVETQEPCMVGADLCAGSLIKNPGGGLAPGGGYIVGRADLVEKAASHITAPGLGSHVGATYGMTRLLMQGLFLAPHVVCEAIKGMAFAAYLFESVGLQTQPRWMDHRSDIIQRIRFADPDAMIRFCQGVQKAAPVDAFVTPVAAPMPGYADDVIMAAGAFIQGGSLELSADGPVTPPYLAFMQGGLVFEQVQLAVYLTLKAMQVSND